MAASSARRFAVSAVLVAALACSGAQAGAIRAPASACHLYAELDRRCGCGGSENYFLNYGQRYCERVLHATGWSPAGLRWRDHALSCLKNELARELGKSPRQCNCARIRAFAFDSRVRCYTLKPASVCALPPSDVRKIYQIIDTADLIEPLGVRQVLGVALSCVWQNGNAGARPDDPAR